MRKVYSLKKEVIFKTNIYDILSIALDKKISLDEYAIKGQFLITGEYLISENEKEDFNIDIPYLNYIEDIYDISKVKVDVDDFYYEIKDGNKLVINIDIAASNLEELERICEYEEEDEEINVEQDLIDKIDIELEEDIPNKGREINMDEINNTELTKKFSTYKVYIVRDGDTIENIIEKYSINIDLLKQYNVINEIKVGDKIIIPYEKDK